jgi:hypothetical protein
MESRLRLMAGLAGLMERRLGLMAGLMRRRLMIAGLGAGLMVAGVRCGLMVAGVRCGPMRRRLVVRRGMMRLGSRLVVGRPVVMRGRRRGRTVMMRAAVHDIDIIRRDDAADKGSGHHTSNQGGEETHNASFENVSPTAKKGLAYDQRKDSIRRGSCAEPERGPASPSIAQTGAG